LVFARGRPCQRFLDGQNFYRSLQRYDRIAACRLRSTRRLITQAVGGPGAIFAGAHYHGGVSMRRRWSKASRLELRPGYFVARAARAARRCPAQR
jgi:hypothetical protein